jgi:uroporphyrinogen III methyltransferase/synthase
VKGLPHIAAALVDGGLAADTPAAAVQWGTYPRQRVVTATLATLAEEVAAQELGAPVITVIGRAVSLRETIAWFDRRPLFDRRVIVTRAEAQAPTLGARLRSLGAEVIEAPATRIEAMDATPLWDALARIGEYEWLALTSQNAVRLLWETLRAMGRDARALAGVKVVAVGTATAEAMLAHGIAVDLVPARFVAEGVLEALAERDDVRGARVLYPAAEGAREVLPAGLARLGATVDVVHVYRSVPDEDGARTLRATIERDDAELVTFTSASAVQGYVAAVGEELARRLPAASIGPVTSDAARAAGIEVVAEATTPSIASLVEAVTRHFARDAAGKPA